LSKQAQVLSASTASADGTIIKMETNMAATWIMREFLQSLRTKSILFAPLSNICQNENWIRKVNYYTFFTMINTKNESRANKSYLLTRGMFEESGFPLWC